MFARHMSKLCMDNSYILSSQALLTNHAIMLLSDQDVAAVPSDNVFIFYFLPRRRCRG